VHETYDSEFKRLAGPKNYPVRLGLIGGGQLARMTAIAALPLGVPMASQSLKGLDSLLSIVQMPGGIPVATVAIGGAKNADRLAVAILGAGDEKIRRQMLGFKQQKANRSRQANRQLQGRLFANSPSPETACIKSS